MRSNSTPRPAEQLDAALAVRSAARSAVEEAVRGLHVDALIMPAATMVAPEGLVSTGDAGMQTRWTFLGWPVAGMPSGLVGALPVGVQIVSLPHTDEALLELATRVQPLVVPHPWPPAAPPAPAVGSAAPLSRL